MRRLLPRHPSIVSADFDGTSTGGDKLELGVGWGAGASSRAAASRTKRVFDLAFAGAMLIFISPLFLAIAVAIRLSTPGPILFRQRRLGLDGQAFTLLKFRTMHDQAPQDLHERFVTALITSPTIMVSSPDAAFKLRSDPRVTRIGRWLRRLSLDELPQLINVLRGEMSIVGPRPPLDYEVVNYEPWQHERLAARPGLTGLWQVSGRNRLTHAEMCRLDLAYIRDWTFLQDLRIILRTPWVMFVDGGGAE